MTTYWELRNYGDGALILALDARCPNWQPPPATAPGSPIRTGLYFVYDYDALSRHRGIEENGASWNECHPDSG